MKPVKFFINTAGGILLIAALIRFIIAAGNAQVLALPDLVFGLPLRYAVFIVGVFELAVALFCLFGKRIGWQIGCLGWLATSFMVYWIGLFCMHNNIQATCLGSFTDPLHLSRGISGTIIICLPLYLLLGSYAAMVWLWLEARKAQAPKFIKMFCAICGGHIAFTEKNLGQKIPCPHCRKETTLRPPGNLKMCCFFCHENIEFPSHAIGEKISCPHCKMGITLKEQA